MNADYALDPSKDDVRAIVAEKTGGLGVDVILEMAGQPTPSARLRHRPPRRTHLAARPHLEADPAQFLEDIIFKGITIQGINARMYQTWYR